MEGEAVFTYIYCHQDKLDTHKVKSGQTSLQVAVEMPFDIKSLECPTHPVKVKVRSVPSSNCGNAFTFSTLTS